MSVILSHPSGNSFVRAAAEGLLEAGLLGEFHTSIASFPGSFLERLSSFRPFTEIRRRRFHPSLQPYTHTWPFKETGRMVASVAGLNSLTKHEEGLFCVDAVYRQIDKNVAAGLRHAAKKGVTGIYAYEDEALKSFQEAKQNGVKCLYDLPIGYWRSARKLLQKELERWPEWADTMPNFIDSEEKLLRKDAELKASDAIFVASQFTANTLKEYPGKLSPIEVIPYGYPDVEGKRSYTPLYGRRLKLLFVGGLSQRKGVADVLAVADRLNDYVELTIVGRKASEHCAALNTGLAKHRWIPSLPQTDIFKLMRECDLLLFPSLFEGFGLVITEAMAQGTPVITTNRTAGPDLITNRENGWLIEAGSTDALLESVQDILTAPNILAAAGQAAMESAKLRPWKTYGRELAAAIKKYI